MIDLVKRGHTLGGGMITPDKKYFYLNIPKNASTFTTNVLKDNNWQYWNITNAEFSNAIIILRDPIDRWVSGIVTYISLWILFKGYGNIHFMNEYNKLTERFIFDNVIFDDHTMPQTFFINNIPNHVSKNYVWSNNDTLVNSIIEITGHNLLVNTDTPANRTNNTQLTEFIRSKLTPELISKIQEAYKEDYNLINSVNIHGK